MSDNQLRVLWLLGASFGVDLLFSPGAHHIWSNLQSGNAGVLIPKNGQALTAPAAGLLLYAIALVVMLLLADAMPTITTWIAILILTAIVLRHGQDINNLLALGTSGLDQLRTARG